MDRKKIIILVFAFLIIFIVFITAFITDIANGDSIDDKEIFGKLQNPASEREMLHAFKKYQEMRTKLGDNLIEKVRNRSGKYAGATEAAIATRCLGEMRYAPAAEILVGALTEEGDGFGIYENPAIDALIKIGLPAVPELIKKIEKPDSGYQRIWGAGILVQLLGDKFGTILLKKIQSNIKNEAEKRSFNGVIRASRSSKKGSFKGPYELIE